MSIHRLGIETPNPPPSLYSDETQISPTCRHYPCTDNDKTLCLCKTHTRLLKGEIGQIRPTSFDGKDWQELTFEERVHGPLEYSGWESRNL